MSIKVILVPIDGSKTSFKALDRAVIIADRFGAHIKALHVMLRSSDIPATGLYNVPAKLRKGVENEAHKAATTRAAELQQQFEALCLEHGIPVSKRPLKQRGATAFWHQEFGNVDEVLIRHGRSSDVIAVPRPKIKTGIVRRSPIGQAIEAVLLRTGRPVVITPPKCTVGKCERVAFGWNGSLESSRALAMTMPWLVEMKQISILVTKKRKPSVKELVEYLSWYDVKADIVLLDDKGQSVGEAMLNTCSEISADFLVVGGFSHSRARELFFGGVTSYLLMHSNIVTIMAH